MEKINYDLKMHEIIDKLDYKPKLLLHACCCPCSTYVLEYINKYFDITILFYNPNIYPKEEFYKRIKELEKYIDILKYNIEVIDIGYDDKEYYEAVKDTFMLGERSKRCYNCYKLRLDKTAKYAKDNNFDYFATTLSISPYKNSDWLNEIGEDLSNFYDIQYLYADFKKNNGYKRSIELSCNYNLYRQDYCGCIYSKKEREEYARNKENNK